MSDSIHSWICAYLIDIGETHGGSLTDVPFWEKKKKVQLVEFLTFPDLADGGDACPIYAIVSDKLHMIPVRFTADALEAYNKKHNGRRLTEHRNAIVQIKNFRPVFNRVPMGNNVKKMSPDSHLVFEVGFVDILGSDGEGQFGNPKNIEENEKVMAWTQGMREHGGGGNVLKLRKEAEQASGQVSTSPTRTSRVAPRKVVPSPSKRTNQVGRKRAESGGKSTSTSPRKAGVSAVRHPLDLYNKLFRPILKGPGLYEVAVKSQAAKDELRNLTFDKDLPVALTSRAANEELPPPAQRPLRRRSPPRSHALDLDSSQPPMAIPEDKEGVPPMPTTPTPSEWPTSPSSARDRQVVVKMEVDSEHLNELQPSDASMSQEVDVLVNRQPTSSSKISSHLSAPTPAQRPKPISATASLSPEKVTTSPILHPSVITPSQPLSLFKNSSHLTAPTSAESPKPSKPTASSSPAKATSSSVPRPSTTTPSQPQSSPTSSLPVHMRRRVPYPTPPAPPDPDVSGYGRILVPNSDTSGPSQSQSQARSEQRHASQTNFFPIVSDGVPLVPSDGKLPTRDKAEQGIHPPVSQLAIRPSQPDSYDGDRSSPDVLLQRNRAEMKQNLMKHFRARSLMQGSQADEPLGYREGEEEDDKEEDQLQSDEEQPNNDGNRPAKPSPDRDLSDDDAQIQAMLTQDSPRRDMEPQTIPDPVKVSPRASPVPPASVQVNVQRSSGSGTAVSQSASVAVSNGSRKRSRAPSPGRPLSPKPPAPHLPPLKEGKVLKRRRPSSSRVNGGDVLPTAAEHDVEAWKNPSFMQSINKGKAKAESTLRATTNPAERDKAGLRSRVALSVVSASKPSSLKNLLDKPGGGMAKPTSTNRLASGQTTTVAGPSKPNKRDRDRLSETSSWSVNDVGGGSASGTREKRKIEAVRMESRATSASSGRPGASEVDVRMSSLEGEATKPRSRFSSDAPAELASRSRKKRRVDVEQSSNGPSAPASTSKKAESRREMNGESPALSDNEPLLKGFTFNLRYLPQKPTGPRLRTWKDLDDTLLAIGKQRSKMLH